MTLVLADAVGFFAFGTNVLGNLLLARKRTSGCVVRIVSIVSWGVYGLWVSSAPMTANAVTFFLINLYGLRKWIKEPPQR